MRTEKGIISQGKHELTPSRYIGTTKGELVFLT